MKKQRLGSWLIVTIIATIAYSQTKHTYIVQTSDAHSCIEPIATNFKDTTQAGKAGFIRRVALLKELRKEHPDLLLFDCGDFSQGSIYYNLYKGKVEIDLMNEMQYDACSIGNHEFDYGLENMAEIFQRAKFPIVCCNYDFKNTPCEKIVKPYTIIERGNLRIGIVGVGPKLEGLVLKNNYKNVKYKKPSKATQPIVNKLRNKEHCDIIVCLSHLGYGENVDQDLNFIRQTTGIDVVLGGHSHSYFKAPKYIKNKENHEVVLNHTGKNAQFLGTLELEIEK